MPHGYFTIEQWRRKKWVSVCHVEGYGKTLTDALNQLEQSGNPGFFRVVQMQRMVWAEKTGGKLKLLKWHASSPDSLARTAEAFDRDRGKWQET